jgi:hypothetical protein
MIFDPALSGRPAEEKLSLVPQRYTPLTKR